MQCKYLLAFAGAFLALSGTAATAADNGPRYTYGEVGYSHLDFDDFDADGDAWYLNGSFALTDMFHVVAGYTDGNLDANGGGSADYSSWNLGVGINYPISDTIDLVGRLSYLSAEVENDDEDGYGLYAGVRAMVMPQFELNGGVDYTDLGGDFGDDTAVELGAVYNFTDMVAAAAGVSFSDNVTQYNIGLRLYFGER
jgi:hypothetical protein